jgi:DNA-binding LacI/PurR family transcriptional regulator
MNTIKDVAQQAGVSKSTVSLVLNNSPRVKATTRTLVRSVMKEMGYVPNANARGLITSHSFNFGVIEVIENESYGSYDFAYETGTYGVNIQNGILSGLADSSYGLITERWCNGSTTIPRLLQSKCVDGLFLIGTIYQDSLFRKIKQMNLPVVAIGRAVRGVNSVFADPGEGSSLGLSYLLERGHKKICFINAPKFFKSAEIREDAILSTMGKYHLFNDDVYCINCLHNSGEGGKNAAAMAWREHGPFDSFLVANDIMCMGALRFCYESRLRVPDDVSLVAYDDSILCGYASPGLTSVNINKELSGKLAAGLMLKLVQAEKPSVEQICVPISLVERASVKDLRNR